MRRWRQFALLIGIAAIAVAAVAAIAPFIAPNLSYRVADRATEFLTGKRGKKYKMALGARNGSYFLVGKILNQYLLARSGYELELVPTAGPPENVQALMDPSRGIDLATVDSKSDEATRAEGLRALAAFEKPYFFVMVPNESPAKDFRDLKGPVNPGVREAGQAPTLGELVLDYYGLTPGAVSIVRPTGQSIAQDFANGAMVAASRTQFLFGGGLVETTLNTGKYRLLPIRDNEALSRALPGTEPGFIPAGAFGPNRTIPPEPVPTLVLTSIIIARKDLPGRIVEDILDVVYDPRFGRDIQRELTEEFGQKVGHLTLHPAAEIYYHRNDLLTSDRLGRLSFVASVIAGTIATVQFVLAVRRNDRRKARRALLIADLEKLRVIRAAIGAAASSDEQRALIDQADNLLAQAELDVAADRLDQQGIETLRSLHGICDGAIERSIDKTINR